LAQVEHGRDYDGERRECGRKFRDQTFAPTIAGILQRKQVPIQEAKRIGVVPHELSAWKRSPSPGNVIVSHPCRQQVCLQRADILARAGGTSLSNFPHSLIGRLEVTMIERFA
jgi:hypothetical protein